MRQADLKSLLLDAEVEVIGPTSQGWISAHCPYAPYYHASGVDGNPSFFVKINPAGVSGYYCHTCKKKGTVGGLFRNLSRLRDDPELQRLSMQAEFLEEVGDVSEWDDGYEEQSEALDPHLVMALYEEPLDVLEAFVFLAKRLGGRKYVAKAQESLRLKYDGKQKRILFPVFNWRGELFGFSGRSILPPEKYPWEDYPKVRDYMGLPKKELILGENLWKPDKPILLVEGLMGVARAHARGAARFFNVGAPLGSRVTETQAETLRSWALPVYFCFDDDLAGDQALYGNDDDPYDEGVLQMLQGDLPLYVCRYPANQPDVDDFTERTWRWLHENAVPHN